MTQPPPAHNPVYLGSHCSTLLIGWVSIWDRVYHAIEGGHVMFLLPPRPPLHFDREHSKNRLRGALRIFRCPPPKKPRVVRLYIMKLGNTLNKI